MQKITIHCNARADPGPVPRPRASNGSEQGPSCARAAGGAGKLGILVSHSTDDPRTRSMSTMHSRECSLKRDEALLAHHRVPAAPIRALAAARVPAPALQARAAQAHTS
eukprot:1234606-Prymnesium_polylepis.1